MEKNKQDMSNITGLQKLLNKLKEPENITGLRVIENIFDYGSCDVVDKNNKRLYRGDRISCNVFIMKEADKITNTQTP